MGGDKSESAIAIASGFVNAPGESASRFQLLPTRFLPQGVVDTWRRAAGLAIGDCEPSSPEAPSTTTHHWGAGVSAWRACALWACPLIGRARLQLRARWVKMRWQSCGGRVAAELRQHVANDRSIMRFAPPLPAVLRTPKNAQCPLSLRGCHSIASAPAQPFRQSRVSSPRP
jgi:hypothetical protein